MLLANQIEGFLDQQYVRKEFMDFFNFWYTEMEKNILEYIEAVIFNLVWSGMPRNIQIHHPCPKKL